MLTRILDAAEALVREKGVAGLTIEAAAQGAGVSKGGLLYHFGTKEALLIAMLERLGRIMAADIEMMVAQQQPGPGQVTRAVLQWAFGDMADEINERCDRIAAVFLAAFHHDPALLNPARAIIAELRRLLAADGLPYGHGMAIMAAGDGLLMARIFGLYSVSDEHRRAMRQALAPLAGIAP
ncbi:MAG: TetR/AcrR family transcriptional regulator [Elsteraceae bacterium]